MRALAEFIVRGRLQAGVVTVWGYVFPPIALAAIALVTLRKGPYEGTIALLLALFPAFFLAGQDDGSLLIVAGALGLLTAVYIPAVVLRSTVSLPLAILSVIVVAVLSASLTGLFFSDVLAQVAQSLNGRIANLQDEQVAQAQATFNVNSLVGLMAYAFAFNSLAGLLIGRWLQAVAFNPGGFSREFCALTLGVLPSVVCFVAALGFFLQGNAYAGWASVAALPLLLVAVAVAHSIAKARKLTAVWLVMFYFAAIWFAQAVICIGFADVWLNFRDRFRGDNDH